jgi:ATP-dependent DNA helicase DinG
VGELTGLTGSLLSQTSRVFSNNGRLTTAIAGYHPRKAQQELAKAIAQCIEDNGQLAAEAGTGTGKTFAYLVPALLSGKKAIISTATKTLQDQLFNKDLPQLIKALGISVKAINLKGRSNYICLYRTHLYASEGHFETKQQSHDMAFIREQLGRLKTGLRTELPEIADDAPVWPYATSTTDNCLGQKCGFFNECFLVDARKKALEADVVVINHHLFFADSALKQEGFAELLPGADVIIFDEAHQLHEIATRFNGKRLGTRQIEDFLSDLQKEWPSDVKSLDCLNNYVVTINQHISQLLHLCGPAESRSEWQKLWRAPPFQSTWLALQQLLMDLKEDIKPYLHEENKGLARCDERLQEIVALFVPIQDNADSMILWVESFRKSIVVHMTPQSVAEQFSQLVSYARRSYIFTSATLTMADSFEFFLKPLGLTKAKTAIYPSPFDYWQQALLYLPRHLPDVKDRDYHDKLIEQVLPVIDACGGRTFFLFTSHRALKQVAAKLQNTLKYPLLIQGEESKTILLSRFRDLGNAVLLGTSTFWEGVDVKGEALSCVIIDKLPFASPEDPINKGRIAYLRSQGVSAFDAYSLPQAVIALKQGVGRLIRDSQDVGLFVIGDPRLVGRDYGRQIFASLPPVKRTRSLMQTLLFIENIGLGYEVVST